MGSPIPHQASLPPTPGRRLELDDLPELASLAQTAEVMGLTVPVRRIWIPPNRLRSVPGRACGQHLEESGGWRCQSDTPSKMGANRYGLSQRQALIYLPAPNAPADTRHGDVHAHSDRQAQRRRSASLARRTVLGAHRPITRSRIWPHRCPGIGPSDNWLSIAPPDVTTP
jgi:hypothetical protein